MSTDPARSAAKGKAGVKQTRPSKPAKTFEADVRRAHDFLSLHVDGYNLELDTSVPGKPFLRRKAANRLAYLVVRFAPQGLAEQAFLEAIEDAPEETPLDPGDVDSRLAGGSRLSFAVPAGATIPYTYAGILAWAGFAPKIVPAAVSAVSRRGKAGQRAAPAPKLRAPEAWETALEIPWWLLLSPNEKSGWAHADEPVEHDGRTELWHTRLGVVRKGEVDELDPKNRTIRGIWSRDPDFKDKVKQSVPPMPQDGGSPFRMSLAERHRHEIVRATADYTIRTGSDKQHLNKAYTPRPAEVGRLLLSSLGASIDVRGAWDINPVNSADLIIEEWRHRGGFGRDAYVRIVEKGALCSPGHISSLITITERKLQPHQGKTTAYLRQQFRVLVRQPIKLFGPDALGQKHDGRGFPFDEVRITTFVTPPLQDPTTTNLPGVVAKGIPSGAAWVPHLAPNVPYRFPIVCIDKEGRPHEATTPLVFVAADVAYDATKMAKVIEAYNEAPEDLRTATFEGDGVAIAPATNPGDTDVDVLSLLLGVEPPDGTPVAQLVAIRQPLFFPTMASAAVRLAAAEQASGSTLAPTISYFAPYVDHGFSGGEVFAAMTSTPITFPTDKSGGVMQPNFGIRALSRRLGPQGGDPADLNGNPQNPAVAPKIVPVDFFGAAGKLLGGVLLKDILPLEITDLDSEHALKLRTTKTPTTVVTELGWQPLLHSTDIFDTSPGPATMALDARVVTDRAQPESSTFEVHGDLRGFALNLFAKEARFIRLDFKRLAFRSEKGRSAEIDVDLSNVEFLGVLRFVQTLQEFVPFGGVGEGPAIELTPGGIAAKLEVPLPSIEVGVFALSNVVFAAGLTIPFDGSPVRARFAFSKREDPFVLQVSFFAGGGFFALGLGADGVEMVEAALEAGARASLDIGVASGSVEAMLGVYFAYGKNEDGVMTTVLTGYVRLRGELDVIELVSLTIEFYLAFSYVEEGGQSKVVGEATVTVTVEVLVFEGDVTMTVRREFAGGSSGGGDPTFSDQLAPADWETWCQAFAAVPA
jgi:hypothetical protein